MPKAVTDIVSGVLGANNGRKEQQALNQSSDSMKSMLQQGYKVAGLDPKVQAQILDRYRNMVRGAQADRGIYNSGPALQQESEIMPRVEQGLKNDYFQQLMQLASGYGGQARTRAIGYDMGQGTANSWGSVAGGGANLGISALEMMMNGGMSSSHGYNMPSSLAQTQFGQG